jgi:UDP-N-acetylglucosamine acyltransferase
MKLYGLNAVGLQRHGFSPEAISELKKAYRLFFRSGLNISQALDRAKAELAQLPEVVTFLHFIEESGRGVLV